MFKRMFAMLHWRPLACLFFLFSLFPSLGIWSLLYPFLLLVFAPYFPLLTPVKLLNEKHARLTCFFVKKYVKPFKTTQYKTYPMIHETYSPFGMALASCE